VSVDAARPGDACAIADAGRGPECQINGDCIAHFAPDSPSGELFAVCLGGICEAAQRCVHGVENARTYCVCGSELPAGPPGEFGCTGATPLCVRPDDAIQPRCVAACP
jgi:hypothetical protein